MIVQNGKMIVFQHKTIRRIWREDEWFFSVVDIIGALTESDNPRNYWNMMKNREVKSSGIELNTICVQLKLQSADGKYYLTDCVSTENAFRLIQSIPSKKAEPFKLWLARVGYQRIQEIEDPELSQKRMFETYREKGYSDQWIAKRMRGIEVHDELTGEWDQRGVKAGREYSILTSEISRATFGITPSEYKKLKGLNKKNLRDHMDDMELILTMLGEATTTRLHRYRDSQEFIELKTDARDGGGFAGTTRRNIEQEIGETVISSENYLQEPEGGKRVKN